MYNNILGEFSVFVILAVIRTILIDIIAWRILVWWLEKHPRSIEFLPKLRLNVYSYAHILTFIVSGTLSYILNRYITFQNPEVNGEVQTFGLFFVTNLITLGISVVILNILTSDTLILKIVHSIPIVRNYWPTIAKIGTIGVVMVLNYSSYKWIIF